MDWLAENWELVLTLVGGLVVLLAKAGITWAVSLRKAVIFLAEKMEQDVQGGAKRLAKLDVKAEAPLVQMAVKMAAAKADQKPEKKPDSFWKRVALPLVGTIVTGLITRGR